MHVLYFHQHFSTPDGSTSTRSYAFAQALLSAGHQVTMVCGQYAHGNTGLNGSFHKGQRSGMVDGIHVIELALSYSNYNGFIKRTFLFIKFAFKGMYISLTSDYDVIFATSTPLTAGLPGIVARIFRRKSFIFEVRDLWPELPKAMGVITNPVILNLMGLLEYVSYNSAIALIGLSPGIMKGINKKIKRKKPVALIPNGCDNKLFKPIESSLEVKSPLKAVFMGAHGLANGLGAVLDAARELLVIDNKDIEIHLIGDGKLKPLLEERAKKENLTNCFFESPVPKSDLTNYIYNMDVGLMILANIPAFYYGTSPNKFFDYLSAGLPVLCNYPGWVSDLIQKHNCGLVIKPDDPVAFANALITLILNPELRSQMGKNSRKLAETQFDRNILAKEFVKFIEQYGAAD